MENQIETTVHVSSSKCPKCEGRGWCQPSPTQYQEACECSYPRTWRNACLGKIGIPARYAGIKLEDIDSICQSQEKALAACSAFVKKVLEGRQAAGLFLHGPTGTGKSLILCATLGTLAWELAKRDGRYNSSQGLLWESSTGFSRKLRERMGRRDRDEDDDPFEDAASADVLGLDDIGKEKISDFMASEFFNLFDRRYNNLQATLISSNYPLHSPEGDVSIETLLGKPVASRIAQCCREVPIIAKDQRLIIAREREAA